MSNEKLMVEVGDKVLCVGSGKNNFSHFHNKGGIVIEVMSDDSFYVDFGKDGVGYFFADECEGCIEKVNSIDCP